MSEPTTPTWSDLLTALARRDALDEAALVTFVRGDLVEGRARRLDDVVSYGEAWDTLLARAATLSDAGIEAMLALAWRVPPGEPMQGLVQVLRRALPAPVLAARVAAMRASSETGARAGGEALAYAMQAG